MAATPRRRIAFIALASTVLPLVIVFTRPIVDDEGYLAYGGARVMLDTFGPTLLWLKAHPAASLMQMPAAALGWTTWLLSHIALAAMSVYLVGRAADRLLGNGVVAATIMALSPALIVAAAAGQGNVDGVFAMSLGLFLATRVAASPQARTATRDALLLGLVVGIMPWTRYETAIPAAGLFAFGVVHAPRRWAVVAGAVVWPLAYLVAGAAYHGSPLFFLEFTPNITSPVPFNAHAYDFPSSPVAGVATMLGNLLLVTAAWPLAAIVRWSRLPPLARYGVAILAVLALALVIPPQLGSFFDTPKPRYLLVTLPWLAVLLAFSGWRGRLDDLTWPAAAVAAVACVVVLALGQPSWGLGYISPNRNEQAAVDHIDAMPRTGRPPLATTNMRVAQALTMSGTAVKFLPSHDIHVELRSLLNPRNGQYRDVTAAIARQYYGGVIWPCSTRDTPIPDGTWLIVGDGPRRAVVWPDDVLQDSTTEVARFGDIALRRVTAATRLRPRPPAALQAAIDAPCDVAHEVDSTR